MNNVKYILIILLILMIIVKISISNFHYKKTVLANNNLLYQANYSITMIYNQKGLLNYRLYAQHIKYFINQKISYFVRPVLIIYSIDGISTWLIKSNYAKLTSSRILSLCGNVKMHSLTNNSQLRKIYTNSINLNLNTQDVSSKDLVCINGVFFHSKGLKMHGNLIDKNIQLTEKVSTSYEIAKK